MENNTPQTQTDESNTQNNVIQPTAPATTEAATPAPSPEPQPNQQPMPPQPEVLQPQPQAPVAPAAVKAPTPGAHHHDTSHEVKHSFPLFGVLSIVLALIAFGLPYMNILLESTSVSIGNVAQADVWLYAALTTGMIGWVLSIVALKRSNTLSITGLTGFVLCLIVFLLNATSLLIVLSVSHALNSL